MDLHSITSVTKLIFIHHCIVNIVLGPSVPAPFLGAVVVKACKSRESTHTGLDRAESPHIQGLTEQSPHTQGLTEQRVRMYSGWQSRESTQTGVDRAESTHTVVDRAESLHIHWLTEQRVHTYTGWQTTEGCTCSAGLLSARDTPCGSST